VKPTKSYEALKGFRTNEAIDKAIHGFIATLDVTEEVRAELMQITPVIS
jgi:adenylosuccinate lyase